jgi:type IV pilus assembly protein PilM
MANVFTSVELTPRECKVVQIARHKGAFILEKAFVVDFPLTPEGKVADAAAKSAALRRALKDHKIASRSATLIIPKQTVTVRCVSLPSTEDAEIASMARFEAERHIPFNVERHIISYFLMKKLGISGSHVLISAVDSPVAEESINILVNAGISPDVADVSSIALYNAFLFSEPPNLEDSTFALINIGFNSTDISIVSRGVLLFTRSSSLGVEKIFEHLDPAASPPTLDQRLAELAKIDALEPQAYLSQVPSSIPATLDLPSPQPDAAQSNLASPSANTIEVDRGSPHVPSDESLDASLAGSRDPAHPLRAWLNRLLLETKRTYDFAKREFDCPPVTLLFLSGEGTRIRNLDQYLRVNLGVEVDSLRAFEKIQLAPGVNPADASIFSIPLGGAVRDLLPSAIRINLLPPTYLTHRVATKRKQNLIVLGALGLLSFFLAVFYVAEISTNQARLLRWYKSQTTQMEPVVKTLRDKDKKLRIIRSYVHDKRSALAILNEISKLPYIPQRVAITGFNYVKGKEVEIKGHALTIKDLNTFHTALEAMNFFEKVSLIYLNPIDLHYGRPKVQSFTLLGTFKEKGTETP